MFFDEELLGGRHNNYKRMIKSDNIHPKPKSLKPKKQKQQNFIFGQFAAEIQVKSLDTIVKDYKSNPFFKIKVDILLQELQKQGQLKTGVMPLSNKNIPKDLDTLKNSMGKSNQIYKLRLTEIKKLIDQLKKQ